MSEIQRLIEELCPDGVEYKRLGEVGKFFRSGPLQKKDFTENGVGCIHYGQVFTHYGISATETISFVSPDFAQNKKKLQSGDIYIATTSENDEDLGKAVAWLGDEEVVVSGDAYIYRHSLEPKFVAYFFDSKNFQNQKRFHITGTKVRRISGAALERIRIPVPPIEIQSIIVEILDKFTGLEAELEAELEARTKQYSHYHSKLLSFNSPAQFITLKEVCNYSSKRVDSSSLDESNFVGVDNLLPNRRGRTDAKYPPNTTRVTSFNNGDILLGNIRPYLKKVWLADRNGGCSGDVLAVQIQKEYREKLLPRFLYYLLSSDKFFMYNMNHSKGAKMPRGSKPAILRYKIPLPPIEKQQEIIKILDKFSTLINDISSGLPAEITTRRKQYKYYRDKLLTFKELES